jgi:elongation factor Ts
MTEIPAQRVRELREKTGAGFMECKKALLETEGNLDEAVLYIRKAGLAKADRKAERVAAEGRIEVVLSPTGGEAAIVEVNAETDFVASSDDFRKFSRQVADAILMLRQPDIEVLSGYTLSSGQTIETERRQLVLRLGENLLIRRFHHVIARGRLFSYVHQGGRIGVVVDLEGGPEEVGRNLAMHVASAAPLWCDPDQVDSGWLKEQRAIVEHQSRQSGKPEAIVQKMIEGRLRKLMEEFSLTHQPYVRDPSLSVSEYLKQHAARVHAFIRYRVGEGIEKSQKDFAQEVMAEVNRR